MKKLLPFSIIMIPLLFGFISHLKQLPVLPDDSNTWFSASGLCVMCHDTHDMVNTFSWPLAAVPVKAHSW